MPTYTAPTRDTRFVINEMLDLASYGNLPGFENATPDMIEAVVTEAGKFCSEVLAPLNQIGDEQGCTRHEDGSVTTPEGFKEAYEQLVEAGWTTLTGPEEFGGQGLPHVLGFAFEEYIGTANQAFAMYPGLTSGAAAALQAAGSQEQKEMYLPKMISGEWSGGYFCRRWRAANRRNDPDQKHESGYGYGHRRFLLHYRHQDFHLGR